MNLTKITAIVLTKNEEINLERCLLSLRFADEILVIDDGSSDKTISIAKKLGAKVIEHSLAEDYGAQRNFAMDKTVNEWILFIDADEEVTETLSEEIKNIGRYPKTISGFFIKRRDYYMGRELKYGETASIRNNGLLRLMKKESGSWSGAVHEKFGLKGRAETLKGFINHYPHQSLKEFITTINYYSSIRAKELYRHGRTAGVIETLVFPFSKFIYTYFFKLGLADGYAGFLYSFMLSFHSFLVRAKLYQYQKIDRP